MQNYRIFNVKTLILANLIYLILASTAFGQIKSGPMVGYADFREVQLWVQTEKEALVKIAYWDEAQPKIRYFTDEIKTLKSNLFATHLLADQLKPGLKYNFQVMVNNKPVVSKTPLKFKTQALWQYRTEPPTFKFAMGSCTYVAEPEYDRPGNSYGGGYEIFTNIAKKQPDFMLWTGDNTYYREVDYGTKLGMQRRMTHTRSLPEMQELLGSCSNFAIWDDHDYGPNNGDRSHPLKREALDIFKNFWSNPNYAFENEGVTGKMTWNDIDFFLLDDFWWKAPTELYNKDDRGDYLGEKQLNWLVDALSYSKAPFKIIVVGGQIINSARIFENMSMFDKERQKLLDKIKEAQIQGVMFISGDRHHSVIHKLERPDTYPLYDFTISPLTSGPSKPLKEEETGTMIKESLFTERNFGMMEISGSRKNRKLTYAVYDTKGEVKYSFEINANDLK